jgi:hypothetical protein
MIEEIAVIAVSKAAPSRLPVVLARMAFAGLGAAA